MFQQQATNRVIQFNLLLILIVTLVSNVHSQSGSVIVAWDPNQEPDLAGYLIYYGTVSGNYKEEIDVHNTTNYKLERLALNTTYYLAMRAYDLSGNLSDFSEEVNFNINDETQPVRIESTLDKAYNFPNPFNPKKEQTQIRYFLEKTSDISLEIFDIRYNLVRTIRESSGQPAGEYIQDVWDGRDEKGQFVATGVYFCKITAADKIRVIKIAVIYQD